MTYRQQYFGLGLRLESDWLNSFNIWYSVTCALVRIPGSLMRRIPRSVTSKLETQKSQRLQFESQGRKRLMSQIRTVRREEFLSLDKSDIFALFKPSANWRRQATLGRTICTLSLLTTILISFWRTFTNTPGNVWSNTWAVHGLVKLTLTIDCQKRYKVKLA